MSRKSHESKPFLPLPWPPSGRKSSNPAAEFYQKVQLLLPPESHPLNSSYALYLGSLMADHGDNGRLFEEHRKEHKIRRRGGCSAGLKSSITRSHGV
jgi:hypothetical protein